MRIYAPPNPTARARRARTGRLAAVAALLAGAAVFGPQAIASQDQSEGVLVDTYTVASGETLWEIASGLTPSGSDVRDTMAQIQQLNERSHVNLAAGEQIVVPVVE